MFMMMRIVYLYVVIDHTIVAVSLLFYRLFYLYLTTWPLSR